jgi:hypothetical protein
MLLVPGARFRVPRQAVPAKGESETATVPEGTRDWGDICRYQAADAAIKSRPRVVLIGDSITDFWQEGDPALFRDGVVLDRGISGQTGGQILLRFWPDVIALHPEVASAPVV